MPVPYGMLDKESNNILLLNYILMNIYKCLMVERVLLSAFDAEEII